ncbi:MAG TPA: ADP-ribosylation family protein, partial [Ktedonobacterales bacterium]|nr:ADP-ribosylation family protein [Ktedonobacterales bacterium]
MRVAMKNRRELLERRYGLQFPDNFYAFWEFARAYSPLLEVLGGNLMGMALTASELMGPFELLKVSALAEGNPLWDARYYNDPPEFLTVARGRTDGLHWGYYVDD